MSPLSTASPADEYERNLAARREEAEIRLMGLWARFAVGKVLLLVGALAPQAFPDIAAVSFFACGMALAATGALFAVGLTARAWSVLSRRMIVVGLLPWLILATAAALVPWNL